MLNKWAERLWLKAHSRNLNNITSLLDPNKEAEFCDLGCDNGELTVKLADKIGTKKVYGFDIAPERVQMAQKNGIDAHVANLNRELPIGANVFDVVLSNQVIEHLSKPEKFIAEVARVLKPGGYAIISTENLSSWHNIVALTLGWTPFSLASWTWEKFGVGNPMSLHRSSGGGEESWRHIFVPSYRGFIEITALHGLSAEKILGAGYYPLPSSLGRIDPRHAAFTTIKARKES